VSTAPHAPVDGFTLIEVLVALAIVTLGMAALLGTLNSAAGTAGYLQDKTLAEWIALNQVSKVRLSAQGPSKGTSDGEVDYAGRKWKWSQVVDDMPIPGVLSIVVKVRPSDVTASGDNAWYADVTGVIGDAVGAPRGDLPNWSVTPAGTSATPDGLVPPGTPMPNQTPQTGAGAPPVFNPQNPATPTNQTSPTNSNPLPTQH
jgi:general secretion pathway protein I